MQLIVLGMHRSGTSSVTRLLNLAGAYFGPEGSATEANDENPKGFWERRDVRDVCDGLLLGGGFDWWRVADFDVDRISEAARAEHLEAFRRIVLGLDAHRPWVIKEPRLSVLMPLVRPILEAPVFVHVTREPLEIAESLRTRNGYPVPVGLALWEVYTAHALAASTGEPRVVVSYGDLMHDPVATTTRLVEELTGLGVPSLRVPTEREVTAFVTPSLHRQHETAAARSAYLNGPQLALAAALDDGILPELDAPPPTSAGATATLRAFEATQVLEQDLYELRLQTASERVRTADEHRQQLNQLRSEHRAAENELQRATAARYEAERRADDALAGAVRSINAIESSGAVRLGSKLSGLRDRVRGGGARGVDVAIRGALSQIDAAREALGGPGGSAARVGEPWSDGPPPPTEELQQLRQAARASGARAKVAVLAWDVGHNPFGRAHLLADLLHDRYDVELWGAQFERYGTNLWAPLRDTAIPVRRFPGGSFPDFLATLEDVARRIDADALYVSKPRWPSLALGVLAKEAWNRPLLVDVDDFEPSFFEEDAGLDVAELVRRRDDPDLALPFGRLWTQACESVVGAADLLTVSNPELEARYGGMVIPHARDESVFDPARFDRGEARARLGLGTDDRLILFGGTPRAHKGILELLRALEDLGDDRLRAGVFATPELDDLRRQIGPLARWMLPLPVHAFDDLPGLLAAVDLSCALQAPDHPVSQYQMPAKVTDAMAMAVPCLVTAVRPLQPLIDKDVVEVFDGDTPLSARIRAVFDDPEATAERAHRAREVFLESYSYAAVRPRMAAAIDRLLEDPPPLAPALTSLVTTARQLFRPESTSLPARRHAVPAGATYDLAIFWKQNDTGIYGRRQDMFLKYLEQSGRFHTIVHFDQPLSAEGLLKVARRSLGTPDQNRLVLAQTLRRLARRSDHGPVRQRTYLYAGGSASRALHLPDRDRYADWVRGVLDREGIGPRPLLCWVYPTNTFLPDLIDALHPAVVVADVVDDNRTWYAPGTPMHDQLERNYAEVLARSDVVLANCEPVAESMRSFAPLVEVVPNACELPEAPVPLRRPAALAGLAGPIIGYAGNLSDRIDLPLVRSLARARPEWTFVLVGSAHRDRSALDLAREPNVRLLGAKPYDEAREIIRHFDVGLIPHLDNEMTRSMNPLKAFVYCSMGVPIVSTPVANLDELSGFITVAEGTDGFLAAIEEALRAGRQTPDRDALLPHSWAVRVERVLELVDEVASTRPGRDDG
jgi:hypothetical protein